jgi:hypothetical protein
MCGEFIYEPNGSFGIENGVRTRKLRPKRRKREIGLSDRRLLFLSENDMRLCQNGIVAWQGRMPCENDMRLCQNGIVAGHSRPYCLIRVFNLISFLILTQTFHSFSSRFLSTPWTILKHKLLISKDFRESNTTKASIVGRVVFFFLIKLP